MWYDDFFCPEHNVIIVDNCMRFKYWFLETGDLNAYGMGDKGDSGASRPDKMPDSDPLEVPGLNKKRRLDPRLRKGPPKLVRKDEV